MNKLLKISIKIILLTIFCILIFCISKNVKANTLGKISIDIFVDDEGNAQVTETWFCDVNQGTECYHPYYNLGNSKITDLKVSEGSNEYTTLSSWNTKGTLSSKAYRCGINHISNGIELCWGISSYGMHNYTVKYNISNFVSTLNDSQMIYWTLIPYDFSTEIKVVNIKIHANFDIPDTVDVWGYGDYGAPAYAYGGYIEMLSNSGIDPSEYMTILVKFPLGTFNNTNKLNKDFSYYLNMAEEGAVKYKNSNSLSNVKLIMAVLSAVLRLILYFILILFTIKALAFRDKFDFGPEGKKFSKDTPYYRDIPCKGNLYKAYYIAYRYGILKKKTDILGAIILKWLKDGLIRIEQKEKGKIFKREDTVIILNETNPNQITDTYEKQLFNMLYDASIDGILENKEFEKWCNKSYSKVLSWFDKIIRAQQIILVNEGLIKLEEKKTLGIKKKIYIMTPEIYKEAEEIYGLTRYLLEYTLIPERKAIEVKLFEEYLVYAQMLGIAKEVAQEFKDLYPDIVEQSHFTSYDNIIFIHAYSTKAVNSAYSAKSRAESYHSGGGGFSSGGGGGGSFGGGGGGRRFPLKYITICSKVRKNMNKLLKISIKIILLTIFSVLIFCISKNVKANSISKISMDIFVDDEGNAQVTEIWDCYVNQGTESYHPYYNLGNSQITNLTVSEGSNIYTTLSSWNTKGTLSSKAYKCGINKISNGIELCWGISSYGNHSYTVKYNISNFVSTLNDSQMIYWTLIPYDFSTSIGSVYIKIHTNFNIADTIDVWGYGDYGAPAYVYNGYIEMESNGRLDTSEYMTILVKFPLGTFNNTNKLNKDFSYYYNMAEEGTVKYNKSSSTSKSIGSIFIAIISLFVGAFRFFIYAFIILIFCSAVKKEKINFGEKGKNFSKDTPYYRDIPCRGNLYKAYYIAYRYGILKKKTDILGAIILKWLKDGLIRIEQKEKGKIFKKEDTVIILNETNPNQIIDTYEKQLFNMLYDASIDGILENKEFERWCNKSYSKILSWFDSIISAAQRDLVNEGLINLEEQKKLGIFKSKAYTMTPEIYEEAEKIYGLKKYLLEYTLIPERKAIEVKLFEEYLVYAQMLGIAKEVAQEFKELYPDIVEQSHFTSYDNIIFIHAYSTKAVNSAYSAKSRAESYSSGGGGFSSGGGGGGSFGGGGGGRRFPLKYIVKKNKI